MSKKRLRSPITWFGGKGHMAAKLLPLFPEHKTYVEPFGGGASLLMAKAPAPVEIYNDLDGRLVNLFRVLRDKEKAHRMIEMLELTPYSRQEWKDARRMVSACRGDDVEKAWAFFVMMRQGFGGLDGRSWGMVVATSCRGMAQACSSWLSTIEALPEVVARLLRVQIESNDWRKVLKQYDTPDTFFYLDPPYVPSTRVDGDYAHEMMKQDHEELVQALLKTEGKCLLSGYPSEIYAPLEDAAWVRKEWETACCAVGRTRAIKIQGKGSAMKRAPRTEVVWANYNVAKRRRGFF